MPESYCLVNGSEMKYLSEKWMIAIGDVADKS